MIRKLPEDSNEENKCPKLDAVHRTRCCNISSTLPVNAGVAGTLLRCSPFVSVVDIRILYMKLNKRENLVHLFDIGGSAAQLNNLFTWLKTSSQAHKTTKKILWNFHPFDKSLGFDSPNGMHSVGNARCVCMCAVCGYIESHCLQAAMPAS